MSTWPETILVLGSMVAVLFVIGIAVSGFLEFRKQRIDTAREESLRQLVGRYERLAENTLDAQQRVAADVAELRARTAAIEQVLRTVE
jgi:hypothetical protein